MSQRDKTKLYVLFARGDASKLTVTGDANVSVIRQASQIQNEENYGATSPCNSGCMSNRIRLDHLPASHHIPLRIGANASEVEAALEALPEVIDVEVTRGLTRGYQWNVYAVTFRGVAAACIKGRGVGRPRTWSASIRALLYDPQSYTRDGGSHYQR